MDNKSGQVRHYAVQALLKLGENRKDVIIRLVQGLDDPVVTVREEVKIALSAMCGMYIDSIFFSSLVISNKISPAL